LDAAVSMVTTPAPDPSRLVLPVVILPIPVLAVYFTRSFMFSIDLFIF
jgi:hypothetical protein